MDFSLTPEQQALKREFEDFCREAIKLAPPGWTGGLEDLYATDEGFQYHRAMARELGKRGWIALWWPKEYGGCGYTLQEQAIFNEVRGYYGVPGVCPFGANIFGPTLLQFGNEEQKREHLIPIARGERFWCQGWSEPGAGSDLASLTTRAVEKDDCFVVSGQKTWTTGAHRADWIFVLARTDFEAPRHDSMSVLMIDMKSPGVTVRPVMLMHHAHSFNEVFFDEVRVPKKNLVGPKNKGWYITLASMNFERSGIGAFAGVRRAFEQLVEFCKETEIGGKLLSQDPIVRDQLAELAIEIEVGQAYSQAVVWMQANNLLKAETASAAKLFGSELRVRLAQAGMEILGLYGQLSKDSKWAKLEGRFAHDYQLAPGATIAAGSSEIQRNIIAIRGLGLPRK